MKKKIIWTVIGFLFVGFLAYLYKLGEAETYKVTMLSNTGETMGVIVMNETNAGVILSVRMEGLKPMGSHAIHIHEKADCSPMETFANAGGHYNPEAKQHGLKNLKGHHAGDMPNLHPNEKGIIETQILNDSISLYSVAVPDGRATVFDADGSSIVVHEGADDHMSQPSGAAGSRIACGVIQ